MQIVLLGSGNVATHLGKALNAAGIQIVQVWSRTLQNAQQLAAELKADAIDNLGAVQSDADLYLISVNDDAIADVAGRLPQDKLLVHTSGSTDMEVLKPFSAKTGVLYPLQTFSKQKKVEFKNIPVAVEASGSEVLGMLRQIARTISNKVIELDSDQRQKLHIAAVFACNFTNHFYAIAQSFLEQNGMDFDLIRPLIAETAEKIQEKMPADVQTGPAVRGDNKTMEKHLEALREHPQWQELYRLLSQSIVNLKSGS